MLPRHELVVVLDAHRARGDVTPHERRTYAVLRVEGDDLLGDGVNVVARPGDSILANLRVAPNPVMGSIDPVMTFFFTPMPGADVLGRIYNLAGELVVESYADASQGQLMINVGGNKFASGVYVAVFFAHHPMGAVERQNIKFVIMK